MFLYTVGLICVLVFLGLKYLFSYWDRYGLPSISPEIPFGNLKTVAKNEESFGTAITNLYWKTQEPLIGVYLFFQPAIMVRDAHLAHRMMTSDFNSFHDRGVYCNEKDDPFSANLFALEGRKWRNLRNKLTPVFTSGQLRGMFPTILNVGYKLQRYLEPLADRGEVVDFEKLSSRFVMENVASVFFGFEANCINDPNDSFHTVLKTAQRPRLVSNIRSSAVFICPSLLKILRMTSLDPEVIEFVQRIITEQIDHREKTKDTRKDFIQQLIDLRREDKDNGELALSLEECAANIFLFYVAGSDTSTAAISFTLHELTHNPKIKDRLLAEIDETLRSSEGLFTYESLRAMKYLDMCVKETLRKYPGLSILNRQCTADYPVPDSKIIIRKGSNVIFPMEAYGMDPKYFPDPESYNPDRFDPEIGSFDERAYFPFGEGPRMCIGKRMGEAVTKIGLVLLLSRFNFEATVGLKLRFKPSAVSMHPVGGIPLRVSRRSS
ncbi:cytochrome P450 6d3-like [Uranotaenia lowii]|uniref:cytochrome P450 6d3-like n=1 Tax=Uranotaenia lowii TaxID=190385 RepID=UPI002478A64D|nr:cytochrome P450 6d3-like [Uranotaenia lowii]